jgi:hypothetical protein
VVEEPGASYLPSTVWRIDQVLTVH